MLDIRAIRSDPEAIQAAIGKRGENADIDRLMQLDEEHRRFLAESESLKAERNARSREIGVLIGAGEEAAAQALKSEMRAVGDRIQALDEQAAVHRQTLEALLLDVPNVPHDSVPAGDVTHNAVVRRWGEPRAADFEVRPHWEIGEALGILDLERAARISGSGFVGLVGDGAALSRALIAFMLDRHRSKGYLEIAPPYLVNPETATATGHLPRFESQLYAAERDDLYLIPTAEVPIMGWHRDEILPADSLPIRYCAHTACFRREAGAHGRETRGLIRVHQFDKVELVHITTPESSYVALESITVDAEAILQALELPYRVVLLAAGDMGNAASKTYDLEVWAPGVEMWLEVSSCSNCEDYQSRRANLRYKPGDKSGTRYPHTLNGSALALPRTMVALLEHHQNAGGGMRVPDALRPYIGNRDRLGPAG